jgi:hypothetical protein
MVGGGASLRSAPIRWMTLRNILPDATADTDCQVRSVFFVTLIPCALSHFLCSACALVNATVLGKLAGLRIGVDILITRDIRLAPRSAGRILSKS